MAHLLVAMMLRNCRWLVGISYRVVFRRDPVPSQSVQPLNTRPHHVHGAIYLHETGIVPGAQPKQQLAHTDINDHQLHHYSGAVTTTCNRQVARQVSTGHSLLVCLLPCWQLVMRQSYRQIL